MFKNCLSLLSGRGVGTTPASQAQAGPIFSAKMGVVNSKWATGAIQAARSLLSTRDRYAICSDILARLSLAGASAPVRAKKSPNLVHMRILARKNTGSKSVTTPTSGCGFYGLTSQILLVLPCLVFNFWMSTCNHYAMCSVSMGFIMHYATLTVSLSYKATNIEVWCFIHFRGHHTSISNCVEMCPVVMTHAYTSVLTIKTVSLAMHQSLLVPVSGTVQPVGVIMSAAMIEEHASRIRSAIKWISGYITCKPYIYCCTCLELFHCYSLAAQYSIQSGSGLVVCMYNWEISIVRVTLNILRGISVAEQAQQIHACML